jgi:hydroxyquinol 1,2-dioxygenase
MSIPVDSINNRKSKNETETTVLGPFHTPSPKVNMGDKIANNVNGKKCIVSGKVEDINNNPIAKATIEIWQSSPDCLYHVQKKDTQLS